MNTGGESAELLMKMMLNGSEMLIRLTGSGAKNAAVLLYSVLREQNKTKGAERLSNMLRSGKKLRVYTFQEKDLPKFKEVAKQYGILYTVLKEKDRTGGVFDVLVRAEDEHKLARVIERFGFAHVDTASLRAEILKEKQERQAAEKKEEASAQENTREEGKTEQKATPSDSPREEVPDNQPSPQSEDVSTFQKSKGEFQWNDLDSDQFYVPESVRNKESKETMETASNFEQTKENRMADDLMAGAKKREEGKANPSEARSGESTQDKAESGARKQESMPQYNHSQMPNERGDLSEPSFETPKENGESHRQYHPKRKLSVRKQIEQLRRERVLLATQEQKIPTKQKTQVPKVR